MKQAKLYRTQTGVWLVKYHDYHELQGRIIEEALSFKSRKEARIFADGFNMGWQKGQRKNNQ